MKVRKIIKFKKNGIIKIRESKNHIDVEINYPENFEFGNVFAGHFWTSVDMIKKQEE